MKKVIQILGLSLLVFIIIVSLLFGHGDKSVDELKTKYAQVPSSFISIDNMNVHYRDEGNPQDSLPLVLIHGTGSSLHTFDDWTAILKKDKRVIRMDLPAFGLTGPFPDRDYSIEHYVQFIEDFLSAKNIEHCILGGNSLGGQIAWRFTTKNPDMVDKLILIDAAGYPKNSTSAPLAFRIARIPVLSKALTYITPRFVVKSSVENVYADKSKVTEKLVDRYFDLSLRAGNRQALIDRMQLDYDTSRLEEIKSIEQPTLVLWGENDALITSTSAHRFHEDLPNDTLVILKNSGHVPMEENPSKSLEVFLHFMEN